GLHRNLRGFLVANFTDEHHVRVVTQDGTQPACKGHAGLFIHLDLVDPLELIFHRVLDGDDLADLVVDRVQGAVKSGGLAAARRPGYQRNSVGHFQHALENLPFACGHADAVQPDHARILPEQTHHHCFAVQHRDHRHADVHLAVLHANLDASVLRYTL